MSITKILGTNVLVVGILGYVATNAWALPLITSATESATLRIANPITNPPTAATVDTAGLVISSATSPGPNNTSGALGNETFQFSDRTHEFTNARTDPATGLLTTATSGNLQQFPYYLNGLEYMQTSNDNRDLLDYRLDVTLSAPVTAFLMIDNRADGTTSMNKAANTTDPNLTGQLAWVLADGWTRVNSGFMPNGQADYLGSDEGATVATNIPNDRVHNGAGNEPGPGNGLNQFYAIYRKNFAAGSHVGFGKQNGVIGGSTYSIAVGPQIGPIVPGDVNSNGTTDINDYAIIRNNFNKAANRSQGDLNGDGTVNLLDFRFWKNYRSDAGIGSDAELLAGLGVIPEPGCVVLSLLASIGLAGAVARRGGR